MKINNKLRYMFITNILITFASCLLVSQSLPIHALTLNFDYARFRNTSDKGYIECYFGFSPSQFSLKQANSKFFGGAIITLQFNETQNGAEVLSRKYYFPIELSDTSSNFINQLFITQRGYELPFGSYNLKIIILDSLNSSRKDSALIRNIEITKYTDTISASDLELCSSITQSQDTANTFYKNTLSVVPNPMHVFGALNSPVVYHYLELYNLNTNVTYSIAASVVDQNGSKIKTTVKQKKYGVKNTVEAGSIQIARLQSAKYFYQVQLFDKDSNEVVSVKKQFFVYNPHIQPSENTLSAKSIEFVGMSSDEIKNEFRTAKYIATSQEKSTFENLTSVDGQREFMAKFWSDVELGKNGHYPLRRAEYLRRVSNANAKYGNMSKQGWLTDRGRVYIMYAEPSDIQRFPNTDNAKPYEIWEYNQIENGVIFIFVDRSGFGDYILVHSTKRGELQDEGWERNLR